jgi:hypothetical protein
VVKAASGFYDAADALAFVDPADYIDEDGKVDSAAITAAVAEVAKDKPHLVKSAPRRRPSADAGARGGPPAVDRIKERLARIKEQTRIS